MLLERYVIPWAGAEVVGGGVSVFYGQPGTPSLLDALYAFFNTLAPRIPSGIGWTFPSAGDVIDSATGHLSGTWTHSALGTLNGTGGTAAPACSGACILWNTSTISPGKPPTNRPFKVRGRTFIVPLNGDQYTATGTLTGSCTSGMITAGNTLLSASGGLMYIWSRNTKGASDGVAAKVIGVNCHAKVAVLTSRRE